MRISFLLLALATVASAQEVKVIPSPAQKELQAAHERYAQHNQDEETLLQQERYELDKRNSLLVAQMKKNADAVQKDYQNKLTALNSSLRQDMEAMAILAATVRQQQGLNGDYYDLKTGQWMKLPKK